MTVTFAEKLARMPGYQAGVPDRAGAGGDRRRRASPSSPRTSRRSRRTRRWSRRSPRTAAAMNRYPDPDATLLRRRIAERYETEPGRVAVGNGSCEILLAAAEALCEPGAEILYAWPAFSMYPYLPALTGAREIRVPLAPGDVHDLEAMAGRDHRRDPAAARLQPEQPDRDPRPGGRDRRLLRAGAAARDRDPRRGLRRVPDRRRPRRHLRPARRLPEPGRPPHLQQVLRPGRAAGRLRDRLRRASAPRSTRCASRSASTPSRRRPGRRRSCTRTTSCAGSRAPIVERLRVEEGLRELGLATSDSQANFSWIDLGDGRGGRVVAGLAAARDRGPPGHPARRPRPHPRQLRHRRGERPLSRRPGEITRLIARPVLQNSHGGEARGHSRERSRAPPAPPSPLVASPIGGDLARRPAWRRSQPHDISPFRPGADTR